MSIEFRQAAAPFSGVNTQTLHVTEDAYITTLNLDNVIFENAVGNNLEILDTLTYNTITNGQVTMSGDAITGLGPPTQANSAVNREFVDSKSWKDTVVAATTASIVLAGLQTVDGVSLVAGDRILVKNQASSSENGIYIVRSGSWTRADDGATNMLATNAATFIQEGTANANKLFFCTTADSNFGDPITFSEFSGGGGGVIAGAALSFTGAVLNVNVDGTTIQVSGGNALELVNDDLTITAGDGLTGGGTVALGGSTTLDVDSTVIRTTGGQTIGGTGLTISPGSLKVNTVESTGPNVTVSLYDNVDAGPITIGANSNTTLTLGGTGTTVSIPGDFVINNIVGSSPTTPVSIYNTTTTANVDIGTMVTGAGNINIGGSSTNVVIDGTLITNDIECSTPTSTVNLYSGTTTGTVNIADGASGTINIGGSSATTVIDGTTQTDTLTASATGATVSLYDNVTTGSITLGTGSTNTIEMGSASSTTTVNGTLVNNDIQGSTPTTAVSLFGTTTSANVDIATSSTGTVNFGTTTTTIDVPGDLLVVSPPASNTSAVNRGFVNAKTNKDSVRVATTVAGTLASDFENGDTVDGIILATGDRILIKNQASPAENGIYEVQASGAPVRSDDAVSGMQASGASTIVQEGTTNGDTFWFCDTSPTANFGSSITFTQITGGGGTPSAPNSSIQFNDSSSFGGSANFLWANSTQTFSVTGQEKILTPSVGTFTGTPSSAGSILEVQGQTFTHTGTDPTVTALGTFTSFAQPIFTATNTGITITESATVYIEDAPTSNASGGNTPSLVNRYALLADSGMVGIKDSTASSSTTTGALVVTGGIGCGNDIRATGNVYATGFIATSDAVVKSHIEPLTPQESLQTIDKVETYTYLLHGHKERQYGVIAQQLQEVGLESLVSRESNSDHMYVNYLQLIPILIGSIKELKTEIESLKRQ